MGGSVLGAVKTPSIRIFVGRFMIGMSVLFKRKTMWRALGKRVRPGITGSLID